MKSTLLLCLLLLPLTVHSIPTDFSQYYPKVYKSMINDMAPNNDIKEVLFHIISSAHETVDGEPDILVSECSPENYDRCYQHESIGYTTARKHMFGRLYLEEDESGYFVEDIYCQEKFRHRAGVGPMQIPKSSYLNCEHTWPKNNFSNKYPDPIQKNDLHHLFPADHDANSSRGNNPFGDVVNGKPVNGQCQSAKRGYVAYDGSGKRYFQPPANIKGNIARALFYFATRYQLHIEDTEEYFLRLWHLEDPVDEKEAWRHEEIFLLQGNRNPYIDYPHLVDSVLDF